MEKALSDELLKSPIVLTNAQRIYGPIVADQAFALLLALTRGIRPPSGTLPAPASLTELHGKTMVIVGLGGIGTQIARRAWAFGMRVIALDPKDMAKPDFVFSLDKPDKLAELLP